MRIWRSMMVSGIALSLAVFVLIDWGGKAFAQAPPAQPAPAQAAPAPAAAPVSPVTSLGGPKSAKPGDTDSANDASDDGMLGPLLPGGVRACVPADTSPAGTVHSGYRKVQAMSIFGPSCDWEPVK